MRKMTGFPVKMGATPCVITGPAPKLGEHTHEILRGAGLTDKQITVASGTPA
jgi:crotonobetainyl-CoA:carnitine CoA-transferase CaiB-like acyl-CoA transferase